MLEMSTAEEGVFYTDLIRGCRTIKIWDEMFIVLKNKHITERYLPAHLTISVRGSRRVVYLKGRKRLAVSSGKVLPRNS